MEQEVEVAEVVRSGMCAMMIAAETMLLLASAVFSLGPLVAPAFARGRKDKQQEKQAEKAANGRGFLGGLWSITGIVSEKDANPHKLSSAEIDAFVESMAAMWKPILSNVGISGAVGACAAAALKSVGRTLAAVLGLGFIGLQVLAYSGYITVNWSKVHEQARRVLDTTGDGRLDADDYKALTKKGLIILSQGLPSTSGFLGGFLLGLRLF